MSPSDVPNPRPAWVDPTLYPFESRFLETPAGALHYVDEGSGDPVLFVHGTPTWSFVWRDLIRELRATHRCIALDHLGFGLSAKPPLEAFGHTPSDHAANLERLVNALGLRRITLVVHDFGGPIGLAYAVRHPETIARIVVLDSWAWSNEGDEKARRISAFVGSAMGRLLYLHLNGSARVVLPAAFSDRRKLTPPLRHHYAMPFARREDRLGPWMLGRELFGSNAFYEDVWRRRHALQDKPMLIAWGTKDVAFTEAHLARWREGFPRAEVERFDVGHFVQEEATDELRTAVRRFLSSASVEEAPCVRV